MELGIGKKIQTARKQAKITQEEVADRLGVSRQTISNWENEKYYPDIVSVVKMSEIYNVSLDYLLKGEVDMNNYLDYLKESTDVVKSNNLKGKLIVIVSYLVIWSISMVVFWNLLSAGDEMGYSIMFMWIILPITTFVESLVIGIRNFWGKFKWISAVIFGIMYMLAEYGTFSMANNIAFAKVNTPEFGMVIAGAIVSFVGLGIGSAISGIRARKGI